MRVCSLCLSLTMMFGLLGFAHAADAPVVTLQSTDRPVAEVLAAMQEQVPEVQLCLLAGATAEITVSLKDAPVAEAVGAVVTALRGSAVRGYLIERIGPGDEPYTAEELLECIRATRGEWHRRLTPEQRQGWEERVQAHFVALGQSGEELPMADLLTHDDPLLRYALLPTSERISLQVDNQPLEAALDLFTFESGYTVLVEEGVEGTVALDAQEQELAPILDALAEAGAATWRMFYLVSEPVKLSAEEADRRAERVFNQVWQGFWGSPAQERARNMERFLQVLNSIPPERLEAMRSLPIATEMFGRVMQAVLQLPQDQRREFVPVMQALGRIMAQ